MSNYCTSCGEPIPEGIQVCGRCLKKNDGPAYHQAVRVLNRYCANYRSSHKSCDECPLKHHCQNTISSWSRLMLVTDLAEYTEPYVSPTRRAVRAKKNKFSNWLHKNCLGLYISLAVIFGLIFLALGFLIGDAVDDVEDTPIVTQSYVEQTSDKEPYWYIEDCGVGDV